MGKRCNQVKPIVERVCEYLESRAWQASNVAHRDRRTGDCRRGCTSNRADIDQLGHQCHQILSKESRITIRAYDLPDQNTAVAKLKTTSKGFLSAPAKIVWRFAGR